MCVCVLNVDILIERVVTSIVGCVMQIAVETMLVESSASAKAILELIAVANITHLVMGTKQSPFSR